MTFEKLANDVKCWLDEQRIHSTRAYVTDPHPSFPSTEHLQARQSLQIAVVVT